LEARKRIRITVYLVLPSSPWGAIYENGIIGLKYAYSSSAMTLHLSSRGAKRRGDDRDQGWRSLLVEV